MHAIVDDEEPTNSKLVFSPESDVVYDNYLHNFEIYNTNIDTKLVLLSACNTGYGSLVNGEGVMSLARAFTYAGAKSVVMSHWRVDDKSSSGIMQDFYKCLAAGHEKDKALRLAKLNFLSKANPERQHPFYWNNFVIMGDVSPLVLRNSWSPKNWILGIAALLMITMLFFWKRYFMEERVEKLVQ